MVYVEFAIVMLLLCIIYNYRKLYENEKKKLDKVSKELDVLHKQQIFFIRKMIHEMKTPLSAIELHLSTLLQEHCNLKSVAMIRSSTRMLATIYDDIAFHAGKERVCYPAKWIELEEFVANRILYFDTMASVKNIYLEFHADIGFYVHISPTELQRVVDNTLSNAIKYSKKSSLNIEIILSYDDENIDLIFKDNGIGMSENELKSIFETYYRADDNTQGLGLGMSIIKEICDKYDIVINIQSIKKHGTTFAFKFPKKMVSKDPTEVEKV